MDKIRIGSRGSHLALWQAHYIKTKLREQHPETEFHIVIIKTEGDRDQNSSLSKIGGQGVFTKAIEEALLEDHIDIAVHSLKDLPSDMTDGLQLGAVPERATVADVLVTENGSPLSELKKSACIATGSIRRRSQLLYLRPDLEIADLRGNIDTRLQKIKTQNLDGIIMAEAALVRLELDDVAYYPFKIDEMLPAVGQGAIGVQIRETDRRTSEFVKAINDEKTYRAVQAERAFLHKLDSGCQFPVGGCARIASGKLQITGFVGSIDGKTIIKDTMEGDSAAAEAIGRALAEKMIGRGARKILQAFY